MVQSPTPEIVGLRRQFGNRLRQLRTTARLSQERLAEGAGLDRKTISRLENGIHAIDLDRVFMLAIALHTEPVELFRRPSDPPGA